MSRLGMELDTYLRMLEERDQTALPGAIREAIDKAITDAYRTGYEAGINDMRHTIRNGIERYATELLEGDQ